MCRYDSQYIKHALHVHRHREKDRKPWWKDEAGLKEIRRRIYSAIEALPREDSSTADNASKAQPAEKKRRKDRLLRLIMIFYVVI